ncbi:2Fe-2S iron-sulfur cluster-binding protein [Phormidesmis priestleyi]
MFDSLSGIKNPLVRSLVAAVTIGSAMTLASSLIIGATNTKTSSAYRSAVYAALVGTGCGALFGLVSAQGSQKSNPKNASVQVDNRTSWQDWRNFVVVRKVKESEEITSFYLQPEDGQKIPNFQPGQFLTIKLEIPGQSKPVIRTYSLSDYAEPCEYYRLSIKREPMPEGLNVAAGVASNFMHDRVQEGTLIAAKPPSGKFVLNVERSLPAVLISNGVGITPLISMAKAASQLNHAASNSPASNRAIWFVHGARNGASHAFQGEVMQLAQQNPNLRVHYAYSRPTQDDAGRYHSTGYVDTTLIQHLVKQEAEYFLCGSLPFMNSLREGLQQAGVPESQIFFEVFTKGKAGVVEKAPADRTAKSAEIVFDKSSKTAIWTPEDGSILEFAEANGLDPDYSCRQGICGTCVCRLREGEVEYQQPPIAEVEPGSVLICIAQPKTAIVIDL